MIREEFNMNIIFYTFYRTYDNMQYHINALKMSNKSNKIHHKFLNK